jgi:hypothetical protein
MSASGGFRRVVELSWVGALVVVACAVALANPLPTTRKNFFHPGTQQGEVTETLVSPVQCSFCHADYDDDQAPFNRWAHSLMAQSGRDPVFHAALAIAEQDANFAADFCLKCHIPSTWLRNQVTFNTSPASPNFGKANGLSGPQLDGISCSICHRMVDPEYSPGQSPSVDLAIIDAIVPAPLSNPHNASYVIDPQDRRRGPYDLDSDWNAAFGQPFPDYHRWLKSPFHKESQMCATCHDVSTPHFARQPDGSYALAQYDVQPNPSKLQQFPEQRTYSEWQQSMFGQGPVNLSGRFGNTQSVSSCQDCHMPKITGQGCALEPPMRSDLAQHDFHGANTWVLKAVADLYFDSETGMTQQGIDAAILRTKSMLQRASDMELSLLSGDRLNVRVINYSGHKLPTGYTEGRRMWINVTFKNGAGAVIAERGAYNLASAELVETDTKVYEGKIGPDVNVAALTGLTAGPAFRLALSNKWYKDNRIPPMGFSNAAFEAAQAGHTPPGQYADGQYWDDTPYAIPRGARTADVKVYYQTTSKEYIEFLRDANTSDTRGQTAYNQWLAHGKSEPVVMDSATITIRCRCDWNQNDLLSVQDVFDFLMAWFSGSADFNADGSTNVNDIFEFVSCWFNACVGW